MPIRTSSVYEQLLAMSAPAAEWQWINDMRSLMAVPQGSEIATQLGLADVSCLTRLGVKGAKAGAWLASQSIPLPTQPNTWCALPSGGLVARLGRTEFLLEDGFNSNRIQQLAEPFQDLVRQNFPEQVYSVLRQNLAIALTGSLVPDLLRQTCSINFQADDLSTHPVILTTMIGVNVTVIPATQCMNQSRHQENSLQSLPFYRIWCDSTFGSYLWQTLLKIVQGMNGGVVGVNDIALH